GWMVLETAGLSFLGLGAQPPQADLGSMLGDGRKLILTAPYVATLPGLVILFLVVGTNLLGDGLRDILDPRLKAGQLSRPVAATAAAPPAARRPDDETEASAPGLLALRALRTHFEVGEETYKAVNGVTFDVSAGEAVAIVGESGSGKTVMAMSILGLVATPPGRIVGGQVLYGGEDMVGAPLPRLQDIRGDRIAYIFQDPLTTLNPLIPVGEQVAESIRRHRGIGRQEARDRVLALFEAVQIPDAAARLDAYPHELSGGQRQRVGIAMALANDPEVLIADEPTTALDVTTQAQILKLLDRLRREQGAALLFITHDFGVVSELCDRVIVMYAGQMVESGTVAQVFAAPRHPYTRRLMACVPVLGSPERALDAIPGLPPPVNRLPKGCAFAPRCDRALPSCRSGEIALRPVAPDHLARCIRAEEEA
ncbi:MAG TPA: oligopeptide/dipeptide ABC transporter ATP-binding protein, partial [Kiloniellaceae bacterium]|nr:oligopeptide/dipeptide ABC transporter ATP-binding protein [Kiloniellaceae bacterium]